MDTATGQSKQEIRTSYHPLFRDGNLSYTLTEKGKLTAAETLSARIGAATPLRNTGILIEFASLTQVVAEYQDGWFFSFSPRRHVLNQVQLSQLPCFKYSFVSWCLGGGTSFSG
jgi:hypothetical protein